jgi:hypothetical protein
VDIHQMQVRYDALEDRLLLQIRTRAGEMFSAWLTRRMVTRLWPPFLEAVATAPVTQRSPQATVSPEAREMLSQAARERPLPHADFETPFERRPVAEPLGAVPLLPAALNLARDPGGGVLLRMREARGRHLELRLGDDLAAALLRLLEKALAASEWGLGPVPKADSATPDAPLPPRVLN